MESPSIYFLFLFGVPDQFLKWSQLFLRAAPAQSFLGKAQLSANTSQYKLSIINYHQIARNINFQSAPFCINHSLSLSTFPQSSHKYHARVAELGRLSSGAKMAMKIFVKRVFTIFASNASFLRVIANLQN